MAAVNFELKNYQKESLGKFEQYLVDTEEMGANLAFYKFTSSTYKDAPHIADGTPYVCLRVPTGGGKTLMAAVSVGMAAKSYLQAQNPMVLWLVPSTPIKDQTLNALKDLDHPYRAALMETFGRNVTVMDKGEALAMSRADAEGGACVIVATIQSFKRDDTDGLKAYQDSGALMDHFSGLKDAQTENLELVEGTNRPVASLANLLRLHRPMVIVDEAHNAKTSLSHDTLATFRPSLILELTATPQTEFKPEKDKYPSNILHSVSAAELKAEQMIKLPIRLTTNSDWQKTIGAALDCRHSLEEAAKAERAETKEYIRPIILFQAQKANKNDPSVITYDVIKKHLLEDKLIPEDQIAVHTGPEKDLDGLDVLSEDCAVRYIITQSKLKEGWDCPFAYVLCSVAEQRSGTAVEQILGRILRMPKAKRKTLDILNRAYAFVASADFNGTAVALKDGLVEGSGFNRQEAEELVTHNTDLGFDRYRNETDFESEPIELEYTPVADVHKKISELPARVRTRFTFNEEKKAFVYKGQMSKEDRNLVQLKMANVSGADKAIDRLYQETNGYQRSQAADIDKPPFIVPGLIFGQQGKLELFKRDHFLDLPWRLDECDASSILERFKVRLDSKRGELDVTQKGKMEIRFIDRMHDDLLAVVHEPSWNIPRLANWIDTGIKKQDVTKPSSVMFMKKVLDTLISQGGFTLDELVRNKFDLRRSVSDLIGDLREVRETQNYSALFSVDASKFAVSAEQGVIFDEQTYAYNQPHKGGYRFQKHYTTLIGDLKDSGEEYDCAKYLDQMEAVQYWIRNVEQKPHSFWLQLPKYKFYPDFVALLKDGRILVVEYKGGHLFNDEDAKSKRFIGKVWADASEGKCLFVMPTERRFDEIDKIVGV